MGSMKSLSVSPWYVGHTYLMQLRSQHGLCGFIPMPIYQGHDSLFLSKWLFVGPWIFLGAHLLWASARTINGNVPEMALSCMPCQVFEFFCSGTDVTGALPDKTQREVDGSGDCLFPLPSSQCLSSTTSTWLQPGYRIVLQRVTETQSSPCFVMPPSPPVPTAVQHGSSDPLQHSASSDNQIRCIWIHCGRSYWRGRQKWVALTV